MKKILILLEEAFTVISLLFLSGGLLILILSGGAAEADVEVNYDTSLIRITYSLIYIITFFLFFCDGKKLLLLSIKTFISGSW